MMSFTYCCCVKFFALLLTEIGIKNREQYFNCFLEFELYLLIPSLSDGSKIVFSSLVGYTDSTLIIVNADGTEATTLLEPQEDVAYINPVWSPDGKQIAFIFDTQGPEASIFVINADGTNPHAVTQTPAYAANSLVWSPDGSRLIFNSEENLGVRGIYMINLDGSGYTYLTGLPNVSLESLRVVPQGYITALPEEPIQLFP